MMLDTGDLVLGTWYSVLGTGYESERSRDPAGCGIAGCRFLTTDH